MVVPTQYRRDRLRLVVTAELLINGTRTTDSQGDRSIGPPFQILQGAVKLHADGKDGIVWADICFYRKARAADGGTILTPILDQPQPAFEF